MSNDKYFKINYLTKERWISYWYQIKEVVSLSGSGNSVLEIGPGNKIVSDTLRKMGFDIKTLDINQNVKPDFVGDILETKFLDSLRFDIVLCFQVLEHLPYPLFSKVLNNLEKISKRYLIITLPYSSKGTFKPYFKINLIPFLKPLKWIKIFNFFPKEYKFNGQHYWAKGYSLKKILEEIQKSGFKIIKHYPIFENPYHYMIICEKYKSII